MRDHRKLLIWQRGHQLALEVKRVTRRFPRTGYSRLATQMTDAAESIVLTIAEGCGSASQREFARFLDMATKSETELEAALEIALGHGVLPRSTWQALTSDVVDLRRMTCSLRRKVLDDLDDTDGRSAETDT